MLILDGIETTKYQFPYMAKVDDVFLITPLTVQITPNGSLNSINLEETFAEPAKYCHFRGAEKKMNSAEVQKIMGGDKH